MLRLSAPERDGWHAVPFSFANRRAPQPISTVYYRTKTERRAEIERDADRSLTPSGRRELERMAFRAGYRLEIRPSGFVLVRGADEGVGISGEPLEVASFLRRKLFDSKPRGRRRASSGACAGCGVVVYMQQAIVECRRPHDCALLTRH